MNIFLDINQRNEIHRRLLGDIDEVLHPQVEKISKTKRKKLLSVRNKILKPTTDFRRTFAPPPTPSLRAGKHKRG
jgi:hypothetical protein